MINSARTRRIRSGLAIALAAVGMLGASAAHAESPSGIVRPDDPEPGQTERISFAPGTDGATVAGTVRAGEERDRYVLWAGAGQTLSIRVSSVTPEPMRTSIGVYAPDGTELSVQPNPGFDGVLPVTGDYVMSVDVDGDPAATFSYSIDVRIPAGTGTCGMTQRISFAPGTDHATVRGSFSEGQDNRFVLRAGAGQTMTVSGIEAGTAFGVIAPDGSTLPGGPGETISYSLPTTGDYTIVHGPRRSEVSTFEFTVTIPPLGPGPTRVQDYRVVRATGCRGFRKPGPTTP